MEQNIWLTTSLPLWERGLKWIFGTFKTYGGTSLPLWERGLKLNTQKGSLPQPLSLPLWERGLKSGQILFNYEEQSRSPCGSVD